jgi:hypothetical protein
MGTDASSLDRRIAEAIACGAGVTLSRLGLRFDRVVVRVLGDLRRFAEDSTPKGHAVIATLTAPILVPAKTVRALRQQIGTLLQVSAEGRDLRATLHGNTVRLRLVELAATSDQQLIGFVHNPGVDSTHLMDLAEQWLRAGLPGVNFALERTDLFPAEKT